MSNYNSVINNTGRDRGIYEMPKLSNITVNYLAIVCEQLRCCTAQVSVDQKCASESNSEHLFCYY